MAFMKISCESCGGSWEVYDRDDMMNKKTSTCPHCGAKIDRETWQKGIVPAFAMMISANRTLFRNNAEDHRPLFQVDMISDILYRNRHEQ